MKRLIFTVTNELSFDQRMIRICRSLHDAGYRVLLVGVARKGCIPLKEQRFSQKRIPVLFAKGPLFYIEYNIRLFFFLLFRKCHLICAVDLDTILPVWFVSGLRHKKRVYDAHELFCEMQEIVSRPRIYRIWKAIERFSVPRFPKGYTVNEPIRDILKKEYGVSYEVIRNITKLQPVAAAAPGNFVIYQGAVNEGRSFETLIPAFRHISVPLHIYGDGNYYNRAEALIKEHGLENKVLLKGKALPQDLQQVTPTALLGITIFESRGLSNYYSLANRFFDYLHAGIPQICVDYPVYRSINDDYEVALLVNDLSAEGLAKSIETLLQNKDLLEKIRQNCVVAREVLHWGVEEKKLLQFYREIFHD